MKPYLLFAGSDYYPSGGWADYVGNYDSQEEALIAFANTKSEKDWFQIVDLGTGKVVLE